MLVHICLAACAAMQIADRLNVAGVPCNLVTGQEVRLVHGARHTACTVEVADLEQPVEVRISVPECSCCIGTLLCLWIAGWWRTYHLRREGVDDRSRVSM